MSPSTSKAIVLACILPPAFALSLNSHANIRPRQYDLPDPVDRAQAIIDAFRFSWDGYYKYAFPNDELHPITNGFSNSRNGWGASAVDALSTAIMMDQADIVYQILNYIPTIDFTRTATEISLFETTIRYLGGMISAWDLLTGPASHLLVDDSQVGLLLNQSVTLANTLSFAFDTPSGIPHNTLYFNNRSTCNCANSLATAGTLILEWVRLSDLTGNTTYATLVETAESHLLYPRPAAAQPFPGLLGTFLNTTSGQFLDARGGWGGSTDSFYEYLLKMYIYDPSRYSLMLDRWQLAADSTIAYLTSHPCPKPELLFPAEYIGRMLSNTSSHLAGFIGGNFILGGLVLGREDYIDYGLHLTDSFHAVYESTSTHIAPESFSWNTSSTPESQIPFYQQNGFWIFNSQYILRPEVIESYYYAYRATGDTKYQDWAWDAFVAINTTTRAGSGFSSIANVNPAEGEEVLYEDFMESFWFAETLKYVYLIHTEGGEEWQVGRGLDDVWVFNTEAHPIMVARNGGTKRSKG
ncbi:glycoside hydrolase family 47 protein [Sporormia fimetaria CBS 119925]|uniref:alpha-1,2-Mannosidase n=1 Tax=Sporormia fimetaria CBS 119925 TaxID=1340428 RepID=A0A6A6V2T0_9PLEO|nr:glycoside hydrolase family 47 protein [Sporormia fimetaria CBS 119925]